jgi:hypothetical protein
MKMTCSPKINRALPLACLSMIALATAVTPPTATDVFNTADGDASLALTPVEFATTFTTALSPGRLKNEFIFPRLSARREAQGPDEKIHRQEQRRR